MEINTNIEHFNFSDKYGFVRLRTATNICNCPSLGPFLILFNIEIFY